MFSPDGKWIAYEYPAKGQYHTNEVILTAVGGGEGRSLTRAIDRNVKLVEGDAPAVLEELPDPDRVFIGGSGGMLEDIIDAVDKRLKADGVIVLNAVTLDTLTKAVEFLEDHGYTVEVTCVNIAKTRGLTEFKMFEAHNPVYIIAAWKGEE